MKASKIKKAAVKNRIATASAQLDRHLRFVKKTEQRFNREMCVFYRHAFSVKIDALNWWD